MVSDDYKPDLVCPCVPVLPLLQENLSYFVLPLASRNPSGAMQM